MPIAGAPTLSSPQKLESPTFHMPFWYTACPIALFSTVWPAAVRSYVTVACVGEMTFTEVTLAETADASGLPANVWTALANFDPSCSNASRALSGVEEPKNFSQLAVMAVVAGDAVLVATGELLTAGLVAGADGVVLELELPLEHAVIAAASIRPSTGAR